MSYAKDKLIDLQDNMNDIYKMIAELCDYIQDSDYVENEYILEKLAEIQALTK